MKHVREIAVLMVEVAGLAALAYGSFLAWKPLGFIVPGAVILALSIAADVRSSRIIKSGKEVH